MEASGLAQRPPFPRQYNLIDYFLYPTHVGNIEHQANVGEEELPEEALKVQLMIRSEGDIVKIARFKSTTCSTLVACCERLCEVVEGKTVREALAIGPQEIRDHFRQIPEGKANRADLAIKALRRALS